MRRHRWPAKIYRPKTIEHFVVRGDPSKCQETLLRGNLLPSPYLHVNAHVPCPTMNIAVDSMKLTHLLAKRAEWNSLNCSPLSAVQQNHSERPI